MKKFIQYLVLFLLPFLILIPIELKLRDNTFNAKSNYVETNSNEIECLVLGSSHLWRSINPEWLSKNTASLAFGGSAIDIDVFLGNYFINRLPNLENIIIELSYHSLEERRGYNWGKNHLLWNHFGINHYNEPVPWNDYSLVTSQPIYYIKKLLIQNNKIESGKFNKYGFINVEPDTTYLSPTCRFRRLKYQKDKIEQTSNNYLKNIHKESNLENYKQSNDELSQLIEKCKRRNIKVILLSPPKYYLYNQKMDDERLARRNDFANIYENDPDVVFLNYELYNQNDPTWFSNENHLSIEGAKKFTEIIESVFSNGQKGLY